MRVLKFEPGIKKEMISRTFHIETEQTKYLKNIAYALGISQSELVRRSIKLYADEYLKFTEQKGAK